jgi:mannose/cellobiose epimerase-like protein (N-acyl-D-glucosamine 2-epimerase family)
LDTAQLIATARTQLLEMYDEIGGGLNATLADYEEKLRVLRKEMEEAWQNSRESSARMRLFPQRTRLSEETENNTWLEIRRARLRRY